VTQELNLPVTLLTPTARPALLQRVFGVYALTMGRRVERALAGALNTMYSSVAARTTEIATPRAIGFGGLPAFVGTLTESLILAAIGGVLRAAATFLTFNGLSAATLGASFTQVVFSFRLTPELAGRGCLPPADRRLARRDFPVNPRGAHADLGGAVRPVTRSCGRLLASLRHYKSVSPGPGASERRSILGASPPLACSPARRAP